MKFVMERGPQKENQENLQFVICTINKFRSLKNLYIYIKTHDSESRGQEEAGLHDERVSYLQVAPL